MPKKIVRKKKEPDTKKLAKKVAKIASDHKAIDIKVLELKKVTSFTDYFIVCSGSSDRQVQAIAGAISEELRKDGRKPLGEEGIREGRWALIDYGDVVAHIFYEPEREHYQIEKLWHDAPRVEFKGITD